MSLSHLLNNKTAFYSWNNKSIQLSLDTKYFGKTMYVGGHLNPIIHAIVNRISNYV